MRHSVNEDLAIALLHRHFAMSANEKLVELGPVSSPWPVPADEDAVTGGFVLPRTWRLFRNELHPVEFRFVPKDDLKAVKQVQFTVGFF